MLLFNKNTETEIVVIAELGVNHMGSFEWIMNMLPQVKAAGADAIKLQLFTPDLYTSRSNLERYQQISKLVISKSDFLQIQKLGKSLDLPVFATPVSHDWVQFIADNCGVIKIASGDFTFDPTVDAALKTSAQIIISSGATTRDEVIAFIEKAKIIRSEDKYQDSLALLHCISSYPPFLRESNLSAIPDLIQLTGLTIGFSSHFLEDSPLYAAIGLGARIFEIHVTDDRDRTDIRDHALSRTPKELKNIISNLGELNKSCLSGEKRIQASEMNSLNNLRKGIVFSKNLSRGHKITKSDLEFARPLDPKVPYKELVLGKILKEDVLSYTSVSLNMFDL
jgi:N,N'-diacetyllegionaminate synthase